MKNGRYRVKIRRAAGLEVKPEAEQVDGWEGEFTRGWPIEADHARYPGEWAMVPRWDHGWPDDAPTWIASSDLEAIFETVEEYYAWGSQAYMFAPPFADLHPTAKAEWQRQFEEEIAKKGQI